MSLLLAALLIAPQDADRLLRDLADDEVAIRDAAQAELVKLGKEKAAPTLARAAAHKDPEVRARAGAIRRIFNPPPPPQPQTAAHQIFVGGLILSDVSGFGTVDLSSSLFQRVTPLASPPTGPPPKAEEVRSWIGDLAADALKVREAASAKLRNAGKHVEKELKKAAASGDREVAFRARSLVKLLERRAIAEQNNVIHLGGIWVLDEQAASTITIEIKPAIVEVKPKE